MTIYGYHLEEGPDDGPRRRQLPNRTTAPARQLATPILVVRMVRASFVLLGLVARLTAADEQFGFVLADKADISLDFAKELER